MKKDALFVGLAMIAGAVIALAIGQLVLVRLSQAQLRHYTAALLTRSAGVASASIDTFRMVAREGAPACSDADLKAMRYLLFRREELFDIGRVGQGRLLCTAGWGRLATPLPLPSPQRRQANGDLLWPALATPMDRRVVLDMAGHGGVVVFTSPTAFAAYEQFDPHFSALVLTQDARHVFRGFGDTRGLAARFREGRRDHETGPRLTASACRREVDVCAVTALSDVSLPRRSPSTSLGLAGMGGLAAGALGLFLIRRRRILSSLPEQIRRAIAGDRLEVVYQPLVRLRDGHMVGVEALARLRDERGEAVAPEIFIGIAEERGWIGAINRKVVRRVLADMRERLTAPADFYVSVNIAPADAIDPGFHVFLDDETGRLGIPRERLVLELTERSATDEDRLLHGVEAIRGKGYGLFIDDLGTGYSSLAYLSRLPINGVKVDKVFTRSIGKESVGSAIVEKICAIADTLGVKVVVEGVESREQADCIRRFHPNAIGQGWFFGQPVSADRLEHA